MKIYLCNQKSADNKGNQMAKQIPIALIFCRDYTWRGFNNRLSQTHFPAPAIDNPHTYICIERLGFNISGNSVFIRLGLVGVWDLYYISTKSLKIFKILQTALHTYMQKYMEKNKDIHVDEQPLDWSKYPCQIYKQSHPLEFPLLLENYFIRKEGTDKMI